MSDRLPASQASELMQHKIEFGPAFAWLRVRLEPNEVIQAEAGAMVRHSQGMEMDTRLNAGRKSGLFAKLKAFFAALARKALRNRLEVDFGLQQLVLYDDDGTTVLTRWALSTDGAEPVATATGVQTRRGVPT